MNVRGINQYSVPVSVRGRAGLLGLYYKKANKIDNGEKYEWANI